jgi:hypothetical protein
MEFSQLGEDEKAFKILDSAIERIATEAENEHRNAWLRTLCHHAALLAYFSDDASRVKHYYEKSLSNNPENPRALYGLAKFHLEHGQPDLALRFAQRSYDAIVNAESEDILAQGLIELLANGWPQLASRR